MHWALLPLKRYADFEGRSRRMEYWSFALLNTVVITVLMAPLLFAMVSAMAVADPNMPGGDEAIAEAMMANFGIGTTIASLLFSLYILAVFIPSIAVVVRRLHDRDMSGWWYPGFLVASFIPFIGFLASIAFLVLMFLPGTPGPNRFGPDPKGGVDPETFT